MIIRILNDNTVFRNYKNEKITLNKVKNNRFKYAKLIKNSLKFESEEINIKRISKYDLENVNNDKNFIIIENDSEEFIIVQEINKKLHLPVKFKNQIILKNITEIKKTDTVYFFNTSVPSLVKEGFIKNIYHFSIGEFDIKDKISEYLINLEKSSIILNNFIVFGI